MKEKRRYFFLDDFEHRLLVGCLMTARNEYIHEGKPTEDVNELILKIIDAPTKKLYVNPDGTIFVGKKKDGFFKDFIWRE